MVVNTNSSAHFHRLAALTSIVREVDSAADLDAALQVIVRRTREVMSADVCTVYFTDHEQRRHVVAATDGLAPGFVGRVQAGFGKGLIGQVADSSRPINLTDVPPALDQDFITQTGAGHYHAFLGVPVTHKRSVQGVLLVRQREHRSFDESDEAFLTTLAMQLGSAIAYAKANGEMCNVCSTQSDSPRRYDGLPGAPGIAIGKACVLYTADLLSVPERIIEDIDAEERLFLQAIESVRTELMQILKTLDDTLSSADRALFDAYVLMLESPEILEAVIQRIHAGIWAPGALRHTIEGYVQRFESMEDAYLRERASDIWALGTRILQCLQDKSVNPADCPPGSILIGQRISAIDLGLVPPGRLLGILSAEGSAISHAAIVARALGLPAVVGVADLPLSALDGQEIIIDGNSGQIILRPDLSLRQAYTELIQEELDFNESLSALVGLPTETSDGTAVSLFANAGLEAELPIVVASDCAGIGLFRSELPFMLYDRLPSEQEQVDLYRQVLASVAPRPVTLRTLDIGGDKPLPYLKIQEPNPALGWRGIRFSLDHPEVFLTQLRAALRANIGIGNLQLLLPMVSDVEELTAALALIEQARQQLIEMRFAVVRPRIGIMIEVPAAMFQLEQLARSIDFFSVGTNDLAQYLLATDRNNPRVSERLDPCHPAILQALMQIVTAAKRTSTPITVCGEMANNAGCALLLLGMGFDGLSLSATAIPRVKWAIRNGASMRMKELADQALQLGHAELVHQLLEQELRSLGLMRS